MLLPTILLVVYVAGYFWLGTMEQVWIDQKPGISISHDGPVPGAVPVIYREFPNAWLLLIYHPFAAVESRLRGVEVHPTTVEHIPSILLGD